jgi:hypothetical protein
MSSYPIFVPLYEGQELIPHKLICRFVKYSFFLEVCKELLLAKALLKSRCCLDQISTCGETSNLGECYRIEETAKGYQYALWYNIKETGSTHRVSLFL